MPIDYTLRAEGDTLLVVASGRDDSLAEVEAYGMAIIAAAVEHNCRRVLCDERGLVYALGTFDTYEAARHIAEHAPGVGRVAIVCRPQDNVAAAFWETVAVNRGLRARCFTDRDQAAVWLAADI